MEDPKYYEKLRKKLGLDIDYSRPLYVRRVSEYPEVKSVLKNLFDEYKAYRTNKGMRKIKIDDVRTSLEEVWCC